MYHIYQTRRLWSCREPGVEIGKLYPAVTHLSLLRLLAMTVEWVSLEYILGDTDTWPPTLEDISEPSHDIVFCEKFHTVYAVKGVWSLLTDMS